MTSPPNENANARVAATVNAIKSLLRALPETERDDVKRELFVTPMEEDEQRAIADALNVAHSVSGAARLLGVARRTLMMRMRKYGYEPGSIKPPSGKSLGAI